MNVLSRSVIEIGRRPINNTLIYFVLVTDVPGTVHPQVYTLVIIADKIVSPRFICTTFTPPGK